MAILLASSLVDGTAPSRVLPFSNKTEIAGLYSILFKRPPAKTRDLTNGSWLNGAQVIAVILASYQMSRLIPGS
jgi:hypothetical protein